MHKMFPSKSLEEIDNMDYPRVMKMQKVGSIVDAIETEKQMKSGKVKPRDVSKHVLDEIKKINEHGK